MILLSEHNSTTAEKKALVYDTDLGFLVNLYVNGKFFYRETLTTLDAAEDFAESFVLEKQQLLSD
jgi:hypothetical protein